MKDLEKIKQLIEEETGIPDIGVKSRDEELISARAVYIKKSIQHMIKKHGYIDSKIIAGIGKEINKDRVTVIYWRGKYDHWKSEKENQLHEKVSKRLDDYILKNLEKEKKEIQNNLNLFTKEQLIEFLPEVKKYMELREIA